MQANLDLQYLVHKLNYRGGGIEIKTRFLCLTFHREEGQDHIKKQHFVYRTVLLNQENQFQLAGSGRGSAIYLGFVLRSTEYI